MQMNPMNNPLSMMLSMAKNGRDPMALVQQMAMSDPQMRQFYNMVNGKTPAQLCQMARNMAKERGTTVEAVAQQLGLM